LLERNYLQQADMIQKYPHSITGAIVWPIWKNNGTNCYPYYNDTALTTVLKAYVDANLSLQMGFCNAALTKASLADGSAQSTIATVVAYAARHGFDSINVDYEVDAVNRSMAEASPFLEFVGNLSTAAHAVGLRVQIDTTADGVGMHYAELVERGADFLMPMSQTYFGGNITKDKEMVMRYKSAINASHLHVGLSASMNSTGAAHCKHGDNGWTAENMKAWLDWIGDQGVSELDIFLCWGWEYVQEFVFGELEAWLGAA
jgi:hypothetical protein